MSKHCCSANSVRFDGQSLPYLRAIKLVIAINAAMFLVEITMSQIAHSQALLADSLDFLADAMTYALSLYVIGMSVQRRAWAALLKAASLLFISALVLFSSLARFDSGYLLSAWSPNAWQIGATGAAALLANLSCLALLMRYRDGDANVRSVWLCTRNDAAGNIAVMLSAVLVSASSSAWPDLIVACLLASLFLHSAFSITKQAWRELASVEHGQPH